MRPLLHPSFVNSRFGDPAVYVEHLFERHALMLDLGDITTLAARKINRIDKVFVSHTHIDHFIGFDHLLRVHVGRSKTISLCGPSGLIDSVERKLHAYTWNLWERYPDLVFIVTEIDPAMSASTARFRLRNRFAAEAMGSRQLEDGLLLADPALRVTTVTLDHNTPVLGFALTEPVHLNVWNPRLAERDLPVGPWLAELKQAILAKQPDETLIAIRERPSAPVVREVPLGALRDLLEVTPGQKIGYVTDVADTQANRAAIIELVAGADILFIESAFAAADAALAADRAHLTTQAAGEIARAAGVARVEPFHFSARYEGEEALMLAEVEAAFRAGEVPFSGRAAAR